MTILHLFCTKKDLPVLPHHAAPIASDLGRMGTTLAEGGTWPSR